MSLSKEGLSKDDKAWIDSRFVDSNRQIERVMPRGMIHTIAAISLGFIASSLILDIKNKDIPHISYPFAKIEQLLLEGAGRFAVWTGGFMADYNRMYPTLTVYQSIIGLTDKQASDLTKAILFRESSNNYQEINQFGYIGGFSMSAIALADIGYIKMDKFNRANYHVKKGTDKAQHLAFLQDPNNWARYSYQEFMADKWIQNRAFIELANLNIKRGFGGGALKRGDHKRLAGFAAASHLVGYINALRYYSINIDTPDRNGTLASEYATIGEAAIKGKPPIDINARPAGFPMDLKHYKYVSSPFGNRILNGKKSKHTGIDFPVPVGTPIKATADGKIIFAGDYKGRCGYGVKIQHNNQYSSIFCHLSRVSVHRGQWVRKGAIVGKSGGAKGAKGSGSSRGAHIHYAIKINGKAVDPALFIPTLRKNPVQKPISRYAQTQLRR